MAYTQNNGRALLEAGGARIEFTCALDGDASCCRLHCAQRPDGGWELWAEARNSGAEAIWPKRLSIMRVERGGLQFGSGLRDWTIFKNGIRKNDYVSAHRFGGQGWDVADVTAYANADPALGLEAAGGADSETEAVGGQSAGRVLIGSAMMSVLRAESTGEGLLFGFLGFERQFGLMRFDTDEAQTELEGAEIFCALDGMRLDPGSSVESEHLLIRAGEPFALIDDWAKETGAQRRPKPERPYTGWCSWYFYYESAREEDVLENARFIKERGLPVDVIQVDMGWEQRLGDEYACFRYPSGLEEVARQIHALGFKAGVWMSPFWVEPRSHAHQVHPEWLLKDKNGEFVIFNCHIDGYVLDTSQDEVCDFIADRVDRLCNVWGFDYVKTDFLRSIALYPEAVFKNPMTRAQALRRGMEAVRRGMDRGGKEKFLLGCGGQYGPTLGICDANRTSNDISSSWKSVKFTFKKNLLRYWMQHWFVGDADCLVVRDETEGMPGVIADKQGKGRAQVSSLAATDADTIMELMRLTGGLVMLGDSLPKLADAKIERMSAVLSPDGQAAVPRDLFDSPMPSIYDKPKQGGRHEITLVNWDEEHRDIAFTPAYATGSGAEGFVLSTDGSAQRRVAASERIAVSVAPHGFVRLVLTED